MLPVPAAFGLVTPDAPAGNVTIFDLLRGPQPTLLAFDWPGELPHAHHVNDPAALAAYDITTPNGFKLFRLRQQYNTGGGVLYNSGTSRFIQFGVKLYF